MYFNRISRFGCTVCLLTNTSAATRKRLLRRLVLSEAFVGFSYLNRPSRSSKIPGAHLTPCTEAMMSFDVRKPITKFMKAQTGIATKGAAPRRTDLNTTRLKKMRSMKLVTPVLPMYAKVSIAFTILFVL